ncbi:hypothetical protein HWD35_10420 [Tsukamurella tyrosinosolvens]|uniref:hypothetical protein n=1 Tax=Tsukamurella tyrosinosolvens TaxID=57704 RepID=UPI001CE17ADD|nr:hypothetical protein [Tsukamurella tyrosinosolvens]MCA4995126.1 hypothetical protein [Tsukamurella tyrosinosolvens]
MSDEQRKREEVARKLGQLTEEQRALIAEFLAGMNKLGVAPERHEITYRKKGGIISGPGPRKSFFPKKYVVGHAIRRGFTVVTPRGELYNVDLHNKGASQAPLPLPQQDFDSDGYGRALTGNTFRRELMEALQKHMT